jgi:DNA segregation ATPase FtsK/SpoIIIE-like protein
MQRGMVLALVLVVMGIGTGVLLTGGLNTAAMWMNEESRQIEIRRQRSMAVLRVLTAASVRGAGLVVVGVLIVRGSQWLGKRASTIYARDGLFPVVRIRTGPIVTLHDINKQRASIVSYGREQDQGQLAVMATDQPGQMLVTMGALGVQHEAAKARVVEMAQAAEGPRQAPLEEMDEVVTLAAWPQMVDIRSVIESPPSLRQLALGVTVDPETGAQSIIRDDMARLVHVAVGGSSGFGKSVFLRSLTYQLATARERPELALIDLENVTLSPFAQSDRLLYPLADTEEEAAAILQALSEGELNRRRELFAEHPGVDSLERYNAQASEPLAPIIVVIDEGTALLEDNRVSNALRTLTLRARKYGLWVIMAGQDWKASSLDTAIRNQLSTTVQFKARDATQSRILLGVSGAEELPAEPKGRALARLPGRGLVQMQTPYISRQQILSLAGNGPRHVMPASREAKEDDAQARDVMAMHQSGDSVTAIARKVFGYGNMFYIDKVREILARYDNNNNRMAATTVVSATD